MKLELNNITLLGIDCVDPSRLSTVMDLCQEKIEFGDVKLLSSKNISDKRWIEIDKVSTKEEYSVFCLNDLVNYVKTEYVLLMQWDGFILNLNSWSDMFMKYDYIGSPWVVKDWAINDFGFPESWRGQRVVGNGGFCLRSKKFLDVSSNLYHQGKLVRTHPEDIAISVWYRDLFISKGVNFAPVELARTFAFEGGDDSYTNQFGFHGFYTNITKWFSENNDREVIHAMYLQYHKEPKHLWKPDKKLFK